MKLHDIEDIYELSPLQEGMLFHTLLSPGTGMYVEQVGFRFAGPLDEPSFERAWQAVVNRHTILRTSFHWEGAKKPLQVVHRSVVLPVEYLDWNGQEQLDDFLKSDRERGFELSDPPLLRLAVIREPAGSRYIVFTQHHLLLDGWSSTLVCQEAVNLYESFRRGQPGSLPPSRGFGEYIAWLQRQDLSAAEAHWRRQFAGFERAAPLGIGSSTAVHHAATGFDVCEARLERDVADGLRLLAARSQLTLSTIAQGAWAILLSRYSGERDVVFGATVSGRPAELEGIESMVGLFINTLPVWVSLPDDAELIPWLKQLQDNQLEARRFECTALAQVRDWTGAPRDAPLFESLFSFQNFPALPGASGGTLEYQAFGQTNYPLTLCVSPGPGWFLKLLYARPRFTPEEMSGLLGHYKQILRAVAGSSRLSDVSLLTSGEARQLAAWNDTASSFPADRTIHRLFEDQVRVSPEAVAVTDGGRRLTYAGVNRRANQLACRLRENAVRTETAVAVCVESPVDFAIATLAILKAGAAYLPLDPAYPADRLRFMLEDSQAAAIVTTAALYSRSAFALPALLLDNVDGATDPDNLTDYSISENLAYLMYTSGSTGRPKGTAITHRAVLRTVRETNYLAFGPGQVIPQISNFSFDAATFEFWGALLNGGRLAGISKSILLSPESFAAALDSEGITSLFITTDLFHQLVRERPALFSRLSTVLVGGSPLDAKWIALCLREGPPARLANVYGPTETTTFASWDLITGVEEGATSIPIGKAISNTQVYIADCELRQLPVGVSGEICIGGDGVARGYFHRPELTAEKFVPDPFSGRPGARLYRTGDQGRRREDGAIEFLGRLDNQVKVRGFRVELGEIEAVLRTQPEVAEAVVVARQDAPGSKRLVAHLVPTNGTIALEKLRSSIEKILPAYMTPSAFIVRDILPLTLNGKIDRAALAAVDERGPVEKAPVEPVSQAEKKLAEIWRRVLAVERVGIHENFFELGGDSILSIQIIARAREEGLDLTLRQLFENQTVSSLAAAAGRTIGIAPAEQDRLEGAVPLTPIQHWFFEGQPEDAHHFNQAALIELPAGVDAAALAGATGLLVQHHDALRLRFRERNGGWEQAYDSESGPSPFRVVELSGPDWRGRIEKEAVEAQASLDLASGPVLRVVWFNLGVRPGRLLFVIHHLVVDTVSWRILMEDFWRSYECLTRGQTPSLPAKTASLRQWATRLRDYANSARVQEHLPYWMAASSLGAGRMPVDFDGPHNLVSACDTVTVELDEASTRSLVHDLPKIYQTQINDTLLTALAQVLSAWAGDNQVRFDLEGHGREPLFEDLDITSTVGWFTSMFPVSLRVTGNEPVEDLKAVKEQLRQIPCRGLTYGLLRYLSAVPGVKAQLEALPAPDVAFNYLGQTAETQQLESIGESRSPRSPRRHLIEINAELSGGLLRVHWDYSKNHHARATIERVAAEYLARLRELASPATSVFSPSDFAQAGISQKELDKLVGVLEKL